MISSVSAPLRSKRLEKKESTVPNGNDENNQSIAEKDGEPDPRGINNENDEVENKQHVSGRTHIPTRESPGKGSNRESPIPITDDDEDGQSKFIDDDNLL